MLQDRFRCQMCGCVIDISDCILGTNPYGDLCDKCTEKVMLELDCEEDNEL